MSRRRFGARIPTLVLASVSVFAVSATATAQGTGQSIGQSIGQNTGQTRSGEAGVRPSLNLYGTTGLIDLPSAESQPDAQIALSYSYFGSTTRRNLTFQVLPRVSGTLRYSTIENWGRRDDPGYDLYDRSFDVQIQVLKERGRWQPSLALGFRDFLGTGVYSAEYLVATKEVVPDVKVTAGLGWGRLAGVGGFENPFCTIADGACERDTDSGEGGEVGFGRFFRGEEAAFFGGVEWLTPIDKLTLKAEYSSDEYRREQRGPESEFERKSPFNFGAEYRWREGVTLGGYWMYGSEVGFNIALSGNPNRPLTPQDFGAGPLPVSARPAGAPMGTSWAGNPQARDRLGAALAEALEGEGVRLEEMRITPSDVEVLVENRRYNQDPQAIGRTARVLAVGLPPSVETMRITAVEDGLPTTTVTIDRSTYEGQIDRPDAGLRSWQTVEVEGAAPRPAAQAALWRRPGLYPDLDWSVLPAPYVVLLAPEEPIRFGLNLDAGATLRLTRALSFSLDVSQPLLGTFDDPGPPETELPSVRSSTSRYFAGGDPKLTRLTGDYVFKLGRDTYARASAGYLERQFAGVSGEVLWKPVDQRWGVGVELNYARQREIGDAFGLTDYDVVSGHGSLYWDTGLYGLETQLDVGRYLAGDWGSTLTVTRRFANGWAVGAYATLTEVSAEDFGEGSFDKGVRLEIPFRWTTPFETQTRNRIQLTSISRDGGARLDIANRLYPTVRDYDRARLEQNWGSFWQ